MPQEPGSGWSRYAADDLIRRAHSAGNGFEIATPTAQPGWRTQTPAAAGGVPHPGTAVHFEGAFYEVVEHRPPDPRSRRHHYRLSAWDERHPLRAPLEYSPEHCEDLATQLKEQSGDARIATLLRLLLPLVSLLPAATQKFLERRFQFPALRGTLVSALALGVLASLAQAFGFADKLTPTPAVLDWPPFVAVYVLVESLIRMTSVLKAGEPMGTAPVAVAVAVVQTLRDTARGRPPASTTQSSSSLARIPDRVRQADTDIPTGASTSPPLEIVSRLAKDHWTLGRTGVRYGDQLYVPVASDYDPATDEFRYRLEALQEGEFASSFVDYAPDENRHLVAARLRRDYQSWVDSLALLWGNLEIESQARLEELYGFDSRRFTTLSIVINGFFGVLLVGVAGGHLGSDNGGASDLLLFFLGAYFAAESLARGVRLRLGTPTGSLLGRCLRPAARRLTSF